MGKKHIAWYLWIWILGVCMSCGQPLMAQEEPQDANILIIDMPYELFNALVDYHELREAEEQRRLRVDEEIVAVLQIVVEEYEKEMYKFGVFAEKLGAPPELESRLEKMNKHVADFRNELTYRKAALEFHKLMEKQRTLIEDEK